jgi:excinuclease ABC subunit C
MGGAMVGVMVVTVNGHAEPAEYRKFKINSVSSSNDPAALKEVLSRRLGHSEWPLPKIIVVDGSTAQMNVAEAVLEEVGVKIPIVGVVKDEKHRPKQIKGDKSLIATREHDILLANAEAHRFAIKYHREKLRTISGFKRKK